jgi:dolichyl-phosphate-mannose--protein O-mannosyl transferase
MTHLKTRWLALALLVLGIISHFTFFGYPNKTVFDEVHFGKFISGYFTHEYFFDIHPPLGKLMIAGMGYLGGFKPGFSFAEIDQKFPDSNYKWLRFLPTLAGSILPVIIFLLALELGVSKISSFGAGMFIILENEFLVQSRFILLDSFLLLFGFTALLLYLIARRRSSHLWFLCAIFFAGLAVSIKWTGLSFIGIIGLAELWHWFSQRKISFTAIRIAIFLLAPILYFGVFALHFQLLSKTGQGDAFMTPAFQKTLTGSTHAQDNLPHLNILQKFLELNEEMYRANATLTAGHPYASKWYTWPFLIRSVYYWYEGPSGDHPGQSARIYFLGNPILWWAATIAMIYTIIDLIPLKREDWKNIKEFIKRKRIEFLASFFFLVNFLPFVGIQRAMFLYHYMIGLIVSLIVLAYLIDQFPARNKILLGFLIVTGISFLYFAPLSYGLPLSDRAFHLHMWLPSWE